MASPDHAATVREASAELADAADGILGVRADDLRAEIVTTVDALVAALAQAEQDRDEAIEALRAIHTSPTCFIDCSERVGAVLATLNPHAA